MAATQCPNTHETGMLTFNGWVDKSLTFFPPKDHTQSGTFGKLSGLGFHSSNQIGLNALSVAAANRAFFLIPFTQRHGFWLRAVLTPS